MVTCKICKKEFESYKSLGCHLKKHKITSKEYYDRFLKKEGEGICLVCGKETYFQNINKGYCKFCSKKCATIGKDYSFKGKHRSKETKIKISQGNKGKIVSEETKRKMSETRKGKDNPMYGKHLSEETKKKISASLKGKMEGEKNPMYGKHHTEKTRQQISDSCKGKIAGEKHPMYGKHHSEESKQKMSASLKGKMAGEKHPMYGKHLSEETKKKISASLKGKMAGEKQPFYGKHHLEKSKQKMSEAKMGKHPTEETKKKMSNAKKGERCPNYKDGISMKEFKESHGLDKSEWKILAQKIRIRDRFTCQYCGKKNATDVHHIIPRRVKIDNSPDNLITLCKSCHQKVEHLTDKYLAEGKDPIEIFYEKWQE